MGSIIRVDIDELIDKLEEMKNDDFVTAEIEIYDSEFLDGTCELVISAIDLMEEESRPYGTIAGLDFNEE